MEIIYLNGEFVEKQNAKISVFDRGFTFGDSIYEVIPVYQKQFIAVAQHLYRLRQSLEAIRIPAPLSESEWIEVFTNLIAKNNFQAPELCIYLQITRGVEDARCHIIPDACMPTVLAICTATPRKPFSLIEKGFSAVTIDDKRRKDCYIKSTCLLPNILAHKDALDLNADEALLIRDGFAIESTSSNLFIVKNNVLITPPLEPQILAGVTRSIILQMARQNKVEFKEARIPQKELCEADEIWLTGSTKEIYPIVKLDGKTVGGGKPGPMWQQFYSSYQQFKQSHLTTNKISDTQIPDSGAPLQ